VTGSVYKVNRTEFERYKIDIFNSIIPLSTQPRPLHLKTQTVPRCKHFSCRL